jgi:hypothetical protein
MSSAPPTAPPRIIWRLIFAAVILAIGFTTSSIYRAKQGQVEGDLAAQQLGGDPDKAAAGRWVAQHDIPGYAVTLAALVAALPLIAYGIAYRNYWLAQQTSAPTTSA